MVSLICMHLCFSYIASLSTITFFPSAHLCACMCLFVFAVFFYFILCLLCWWHVHPSGSWSGQLPAYFTRQGRCYVAVLCWRERVLRPLQGGADGELWEQGLQTGHQQYLQVKNTWATLDTHTLQPTSQIICIQYPEVIRFAPRPCFPGNRSARGWWWWRWGSDKLPYSDGIRTHWVQIRGQKADKVVRNK